MKTLLEVKNLVKRFSVEKGIFKKQGFIEAVKNVSFTIEEGEIVSLVGESGSGKSTIGRMIQGLIQSSSGEIYFEGKKAELLELKTRAQYAQTIFQDPFASLNPKLSIGFILKEALEQSKNLYKKEELLKEVKNLLDAVGLPQALLNDYPHQFSGGQRQRIAIARALAMQPKLIIADEPVSALDLSIQAQILNLLMDLNKNFGISYLLIAHDLSIVQQMSDKVMVIKNGEIVEQGSNEQIFNDPKETYTKNLLSSVPLLEI
ncbi:MAG: ABC transporter ATP-binding protein [Elusimicrobia bacterium]|nr:ABC transporter ATP-binding protein [Elusimicrobiota bacterium]